MRKGFSLIEVLVAIVIMLIFTTYGVASLLNNGKKQKQVTAFEEFRQTLQLARNNAAAGKKPEECVDPLLGWRVRFTTSSYVVEALCTATYPVPPTTPYLSRTKTLPSGVILAVSPVLVTEIVFRPLGQGTITNLGPAVVSNISMTVSSQADQNTVIVTDRGEIQ
ncbi:MAG: type II secretion system protein [Patescibacteria group bacterium]